MQSKAKKGVGDITDYEDVSESIVDFFISETSEEMKGKEREGKGTIIVPHKTPLYDIVADTFSFFDRGCLVVCRSKDNAEKCCKRFRDRNVPYNTYFEGSKERTKGASATITYLACLEDCKDPLYLKSFDYCLVLNFNFPHKRDRKVLKFLGDNTKRGISLCSVPFVIKKNSFGPRIGWTFHYNNHPFREVIYLKQPNKNSWDIEYNVPKTAMALFSKKRRGLSIDYSERLCKRAMSLLEYDARVLKEKYEDEGKKAEIVKDLRFTFDRRRDVSIVIRPTRDFTKYYRLCAMNGPYKKHVIHDLVGNYWRFGDIAKLRYFEDDILGLTATIEGKLLTNIPYMTEYWCEDWTKFKQAKLGGKGFMRWVEYDEVIQFGKFKGMKIGDLPYSYRFWLYNEMTKDLNNGKEILSKYKRRLYIYLKKKFGNHNTSENLVEMTFEEESKKGNWLKLVSENRKEAMNEDVIFEEE